MSSRFKFEDFRKQMQAGKLTPDPENRKPDNAYIVASINEKLTSCLWKVYHKTPSTNAVFSSLGIGMVMAFVKLGTSGKTSDEIASRFRFPDDLVLQDGYSKLFQSLRQSSNNGVEITIANGVFAPFGTTFRQDAMQIGQSLGFQFLNVNFNEPELAKQEINKWVQQSSDMRILNVISTEDVDKKTRLVLLSTIHFKGVWKKGFSTQDTKVKTFYGKTVTEIPMMSATHRFPYSKLGNLDCHAIGLPYQGDRFMMIIILPNYADLTSLEDRLEEDIFVNVRKQLRVDKEIHVEIPKIRLTSKIELKPLLETIGIKSLFNTTADLDPMFDRKDNMYVSTVAQQACVEISEEGDTEVAEPLKLDPANGCTRVKEKVKAAPFPVKEEPKAFHARHSFMFCIYDNKYDNVLLVGICN
jgi:serpin B